MATGYVRTNSRFPASMQPKYRDQGRFTVLLITEMRKDTPYLL